MSVEPTYRLAGRRVGTVLFGLAVPQLVLVTAGVLAAVLVPARHRSGLGVAVGLAAAIGCGLAAFAKLDGRPAWQELLTIIGYAVRGAAGRRRWLAPLPLLTATPTPAATSQERTPRSGAGERVLPRCLAGLGLLAVARPEWAGAGGTLAPVGLVVDRRSGSVTAVIGVRGSGFGLLDPPERSRRLAGWAQVLSQFGREASPVARLGWCLWSAPATVPTEHLAWLDTRTGPHVDGPHRTAEVDYRRLLADAGSLTWRHELRVWLTVDPRRAAGSVDPADAALAAARALTDRCTAAGLVCSPPLSPAEIADAARAQSDPSTQAGAAPARRGLAERAGLASAASAGAPPDLVHAAPLAVEMSWDAVRVDGAWHRVFWVAQWPGLDLAAGWWEPLLLDPVGVRTLAVVLEPVPARVSRRRINSESVSVEGQLRLRERHAFRVPVGLQQAQSEVDQREAELQAGFSEYGYLALACVTAASRPGLEEASQALVDAAARCGIVEVRPLHGRHDAAWACTLPLGRVPDRELYGGPR